MEIDAEFLVQLICPDFLEEHLIPMLKRDGPDVCVERLRMRVKWKPSYCKTVIDYLQDKYGH